jgi:hypothetical protein
MNQPPARQSPDSHGPVGHETSDASPLLVGLFALAVALMVALSMLLLVWTFWRFEKSAERTDPVASPVASDQMPPDPRLQTQPSADLARLRDEENQTLGSYKWIDPRQGIVQVPIDRAIDLLAERGLPEPEAAEPTTTPQEPPP